MRFTMLHSIPWFLPAAAGLLLCAAKGRSEDYENPPVEYSMGVPSNRVSALMERARAGVVRLERQPGTGYLRPLLAALEIPESSQTLVFGKTSLQRERIAPATPRAIYFNDDTYVGFCRDGDVLEISTADAGLGTVFYTMDQKGEGRPAAVRQTDNCLACHGSTATRDVPGHLIRSVYVDERGFPILTAKTYRTTPASPLPERWGGWYVTGTHGDQKHLGNLIVRTGGDPEGLDNAEGMNAKDLSRWIDASPYPVPGSDIVALMVLEHQTHVHNLLVRASFASRQALHYEAELTRELGRPLDPARESILRRIRHACEPLVAGLLCAEEAPLEGWIEGTSGFAEEFQRRGPFDSKGRSLRQLDMERRMFTHPCSYLIYSESFAALPREAMDYTLGRIREILTGPEAGPKFGHLSPADRTAIHEILMDTLPVYADRVRAGTPGGGTRSE